MHSVDPAEIRKRVVRRHKARLSFLIHLAAYIGGNLFLWGIWFFLQVGIIPSHSESDHVLWPLIVMLGWGIFLLMHGIGVVLVPRFQESQERAIQEETEREVMRLSGDAAEKRKRGNVRLAEDGELIYEDETPKRKVSSGTE